MDYIKNLNHFKLNRSSVITVGKFDGIHKGHRKLISRVKEIGRQRGLKTVIFTFDISPQIRVSTMKESMLMTNQERYNILYSIGVDMLVECPFTDSVQNMEAEEFVRSIMIEQLHASVIVVGSDFYFGRERSKNSEFLCRIGREYGFVVEVLEKEKDGERDISSSYIREELTGGHMEKVEQLLGHPYFIKSKILYGSYLGHSLGFPTINQIPASEKMLPPRGVYVSVTKVAAKWYHSVTNIGKKPTVQGRNVGVETYLFQCDQNLYGREAVVEILSYRRPECKFHSLEELKAQLRRDLQDAQDFFK
mgnify:CR=1 FL=1